MAGGGDVGIFLKAFIGVTFCLGADTGMAGLFADTLAGGGMPPTDFGVGSVAPEATFGEFVGGEVVAFEPLPAVSFVQVAPLALHRSQLVGGMPRTASC